MTSSGPEAQPPSLLNLGQDIFVVHILPQLDARDLNSLRQTCREFDRLVSDQAVWHAVYNAMFPPPEARPIVGRPLDTLPNWEYRCTVRFMARVFTWGSSEAGRLGVTLGEVRYGYRGRRGVNRPWAVPAFAETRVRDIGCGGYFTAVLSNEGTISVVGDFAGQLRGAGPPRDLGVSEPIDGRFTSFSCGRSHILAQTSTGQVVSWRHSRESLGVVLNFGDLEVRKVVAGWSASAAIVGDSGIVVWPLSTPEYPGKDVNYIAVPHTGGSGEEWQVADLAIGEQFVVFTTNNGRIFSVRLNFDEGVLPAPEFLAQIHEPIFGAGIVKVCAVLNRMLAITTQGWIVQAQWQDGQFVDVRVLRLKNVVQVAAGDHHCLALIKTGELFAWGTEPHSCGALGMGPPSDIEAAGGETHPIRWFASDSSVSEPTQVMTLPMYKIAAGGWHSAAIGAGP